MSIKSQIASPSDRTGFNRNWYAADKDLKIYTPTNTAEVVRIFQDILDSNLYADNPNSVQITCGRHCYEDFVYNENTKVVIDMTGLKSYNYDLQEDTFSVDVGYNNWDIYRLLNNVYKKTFPAGSCYSVGLGGHITGGGYGLLSRLYGLTIDYLTSVDIVITRDGKNSELVTASAETNPDLFWAIKGGGGGQFGIITRYSFSNLPPAPEIMSTFSFSFDWKDDKGNLIITKEILGQILDFFNTYLCKKEENYWNSWANLKLNHMDAGNITVSRFSYYVPSLHGSFDEYKKILEADSQKIKSEFKKILPLSTNHFESHGHPYISSTKLLNPPEGSSEVNRHYTYLAGTQQVSGSGANQSGYYKSAYLTDTWKQTQINGAYKYLTQVVNNPETGEVISMDQSLIQVDSYGGKINTVKSEDTAIPQRSSVMKLQFQTYWDADVAVDEDVDPKVVTAHTGWLTNMYSDIFYETYGYPDPKARAESNVDGCYFNYPDKAIGYVGGVNTLDFALQLYFGDNLPRLKAVKKQYNPNGWFGNSQTIS